MGLNKKQVSDNQGRQQLPSAAEISKPPSLHRQQPPPEPLKCPRCSSTNTKFCYYNNYNKSQPRHFCKSCKRHWTKGGTLRNVPVGGGRKNKRPKIPNPTTSAAAASSALPPATTASDHQKGISNILFEAFIRSSSPLLNNNNKIIPTCLNETSPPLIKTEIFNQFSNFETNAAFMNIPTLSYHQQPLINGYDQFLENSVEESTVTTVNVQNRACSPLPWPSCTDMDFSSGWSWNEINDVFSASSDLNISWNYDDGDGIKFKPIE